VKLRLLEIGRVTRTKGAIDQDRLKRRYGQLLETTSRVVGQARRFSEEIARGVKRARQLVLEGLRQELSRQAGDETCQWAPKFPRLWASNFP